MVTYVVLAPESELTDQVTTDECRDQVEAYKKFAGKQTDVERLSTAKEKPVCSQEPMPLTR